MYGFGYVDSRQSNAILEYLWKISLAFIHNNLHLIFRSVVVPRPILASKKDEEMIK